jgi:hypothetical protein
MAKAKKIKVQTPKLRKGQLVDPRWDGCEGWSGEKFHKTRQAAAAYYYGNYKSGDMIDMAYDWMLANDFTKDDVRAAKASPSHDITQQVGYMCRMLTMGMPDYYKPHDEYWQSLAGTGGVISPVTDYILPRINAAIENGKPLVAAAKAKADAEKKANENIYKPSIRELMHEACVRMSEEIDEYVDSFQYDDKDAVKKFDPVKMLRSVQAKAGHARHIKTFYEGEYQEIKDLVVGYPKPAELKKMSDYDRDQWEQLKEGYDHISTQGQKNLLELYNKIMDACDIIAAEAKTARAPRKVKAKSADDLVKKLQYKMSDVEYGIASVPPSSLIGANIAIVYNTKNRKLGIYYASNIDPKGLQREGSGFGVKGTTITGYDEEKSVQKTLRKPKETLGIVKKTTRAKAEKTFQSLTTTDTKLNGRFNKETILLAVFAK